MATRPVFVPVLDKKLVVERLIDFPWNAGFSIRQKRRNIEALHAAAKEANISPVLEISTRSTQELGFKLSAFNLKLELKNGQKVSVEAAFQSSKVFENGGPFKDFLSMTGKQIKKDPRPKNSGKLIKFIFQNEEWPLIPRTAFYDWLYLNAILQNGDLQSKILQYSGFTDIEFNPSKQINCQARSAALFVSLEQRRITQTVLSNREDFLVFLRKSNTIIESKTTNLPIQQDMFAPVHNSNQVDLLQIINESTDKFMERHWKKTKLKKHKIPKWIELDISNLQKLPANDYGCFILIKGKLINIIGQPYVKEPGQEEALMSFSAISSKFLQKPDSANKKWNDFDKILFLQVPLDLVYLTKSIKEFLLSDLDRKHFLPTNK